MNEVEIEQLLYNAARAQAVVHGFRLGSGADQQIQGYATVAAREIVLSPDNDGMTQDRLTDAVRAFRLLVDTMISVRKDAYRGKPELLASNVIVFRNNINSVNNLIAKGKAVVDATGKIVKKA